MAGVLSTSVLQNISEVTLMDKTFHGAVTDLQIWRRLLTTGEIDDFNQCQPSIIGDTYRWDPSQLTVQGRLEIEDISVEEYCPRSRERILVGSGRLMGFFQSEKFCREVLQGRVAVAENVEILRAMGEENEYGDCPEFFYTGYTKDQNGDFVDYYDKNPMTLRKVEIQIIPFYCLSVLLKPNRQT